MKMVLDITVEIKHGQQAVQSTSVMHRRMPGIIIDHAAWRDGSR